jgi:hypothetical protein
MITEFEVFFNCCKCPLVNTCHKSHAVNLNHLEQEQSEETATRNSHPQLATHAVHN